MTERQKKLFPFGTDGDADVFRERLAALYEELAEYQQHKGQPGYYFGRGFLGQTRKSITRLEQWLADSGK